MSDDDKQMLLWAARAGGLKVHEVCDGYLWIKVPSDIEDGQEQLVIWSSLQSDGDALRLNVHMDFSITRNYFANKWVIRKLNLYDMSHIVEVFERIDEVNPAKSLRFAITRAAAEIGKAMGDR